MEYDTIEKVKFYSALGFLVFTGAAWVLLIVAWILKLCGVE